ncbi:DedA family protein [Patescibacteria group bacterium]|nr:DedA family protein [Patescibacteria group bacterium]
MVQHIPSYIQVVAPVVNQYGYLAVAGLLFLEDFGILVPGETVLIAAAFYAGLGQLNILLIILIGFIAAVAGDNVGFAIGEYGGRPLVERFGRYVLLTKERLDKAEHYFNRHGGKIVAVARFIDGLRQLNGIIAGISEMRWLKFITFNAIGAVVWVTFWSLVGYYGGEHIASFLHVELYITIAVIILVVARLAYKRLAKPKKT